MLCTDPRLTHLQRIGNTLMDGVWDAHDWATGALIGRGANLPRADRADSNCEFCHGAGEYPVDGDTLGQFLGIDPTFYDGACQLEECHCIWKRNPYYRAARKLTAFACRLHERIYTLPPYADDEECPF